MAPIKFLPKKPVDKDSRHKGVVVYYGRLDIVLGLLMLIFSAFFVYKYVQLSLFPPKIDLTLAVASHSLPHK